MTDVPARQRAYLAACGRRPLHALCALLAALGPVPPPAELRAMIRRGRPKGAAAMWARLRARESAEASRLRARESAEASRLRAAAHSAACKARMLAWNAERKRAGGAP